jgi:formiminoglutamase
MIELVPVRVSLADTAPGDQRVGHLLGRAVGPGDTPRVAIVGFPSDEGVRRNGGRAGAALGPAAIRPALYRLTPDAQDAERFGALLERTVDLGDVPATGDLDRDQATLGRAIGPLLRDGTFVIVLGGGHEAAYGHFLGYVEAGLRPALLNWDSHTDVRPLREGRGHSGSPFRQALEHPSQAARGYTVAGLAPHATSAAHVAYVAARGRAVFADACTPTLASELYARLEGPAAVSFDLDVVEQASAPGVSAPAAAGLPARYMLDVAYLAGRTAAVTSCDLVEVAPPLDPQGITARLAALMAWQILRGLAAREA